ncbi:MAG: hypothetical protein AAF525_03805 [Pseudomonadota bacterium]
MTEKSDNQLVDETAATFKAVVESTDEITRARLQAARRSALDAADRNTSPFRWQRTVPGAAMAACLVVGVLMLTPVLDGPDPAEVASLPLMPVLNEDDMAVVQDLELIEELAFVAYLAELDFDDGQVL